MKTTKLVWDKDGRGANWDLGMRGTQSAIGIVGKPGAIRVNVRAPNAGYEVLGTFADFDAAKAAAKTWAAAR